MSDVSSALQLPALVVLSPTFTSLCDPRRLLVNCTFTSMTKPFGQHSSSQQSLNLRLHRLSIACVHASSCAVVIVPITRNLMNAVTRHLASSTLTRNRA